VQHYELLMGETPSSSASYSGLSKRVVSASKRSTLARNNTSLCLASACEPQLSHKASLTSCSFADVDSVYSASANALNAHITIYSNIYPFFCLTEKFPRPLGHICRLSTFEFHRPSLIPHLYISHWHCCNAIYPDIKYIYRFS